MTTVTTKRCFRCMAGEPVAVFATTDSLPTALRVSAEAIEFVSGQCGLEDTGFCVPCVALREDYIMNVWRNRFRGYITLSESHWQTVRVLMDRIV